MLVLHKTVDEGSIVKVGFINTEQPMNEQRAIGRDIELVRPGSVRRGRVMHSEMKTLNEAWENHRQ